MFTGIVEELGEVVGLVPQGDCAVLEVRCRVAADGVQHGASIAVNGVCLTVIGDESSVASDQHTLRFDVMAETLTRSVVGLLASGAPVNLERAMRADGRLDGHIVQGHVDGTAHVVSRTPGDAWESVRISLPVQLARYVAEKGSVAVDGVSLTVSALGEDWFEVGLIPETLRSTTLGHRQAGDAVNIEVDVIAKYAERLLAYRSEPTSTAGPDTSAA
jgi:riboflavin synthase